MDESWKNGLISAQEMRKQKTKLSSEPSAEALSLVKNLLEEVSTWGENNRYSCEVSNPKHFKLVPQVVSILCDLGYNVTFKKVNPDYRVRNDVYYEIHITY